MLSKKNAAKKRVEVRRTEVEDGVVGLAMPPPLPSPGAPGAGVNVPRVAIVMILLSDAVRRAHDVGGVGGRLEVEHAFQEFIDDDVGLYAQDAVPLEDIGPLPLNDAEVRLDERAEIVAEGIVNDVHPRAVGIAAGDHGNERVFQQKRRLGLFLGHELRLCRTVLEGWNVGTDSAGAAGVKCCGFVQ